MDVGESGHGGDLLDWQIGRGEQGAGGIDSQPLDFTVDGSAGTALNFVSTVERETPTAATTSAMRIGAQLCL